MMLHWQLPRPRPLVALGWAAAGFMVTLLLIAVLPLAVGMRTYVVRSGSMTPAIDTGDLVITRKISPAEASVGEIVVFKDPDQSGRLITHRVRGVQGRGGRYYFVTRGDANTGFERWNVPSSAMLGEIEYRIPKLGYLVAPAASGPGHLLLVVIPALALCALGLIRIWDSGRPGEPQPSR
jgi:signal peptidase I